VAISLAGGFQSINKNSVKLEEEMMDPVDAEAAAEQRGRLLIWITAVDCPSSVRDGKYLG
jgi:hypothetical protein